MTINEDDKNFWLESVKDVKEIKTSEIPLKKENTLIKVRQHQQFAVNQEFDKSTKNLSENNTGGIDKSTLKKFKREEFKIEDRLDLHGFTADDAYNKVNDFVVSAYNSGKRCIIIITGKGLTVREGDDIFTVKGILKRQVPQWLDMPQLRAMILTYKNPSESLGGTGALYILLKKNKNITKKASI